MNLLLLVTLLLITASWRAYGYKPEIERGLRTDASYCDYRLDVRWNRSDCGLQNRTKESCELRGCCWDPNKDTLMCFYPNRQEETRDLSDLGRRRRKTGVQAKPFELENCLCDGIEIITRKGPSDRNFNVNCRKDKQKDEKEKNVPSSSNKKKKEKNCPTNNNKKEKEKNIPTSSNKNGKEKNVPTSSNKKEKKKNVPTNNKKQESTQEKATISCKFRGNPHPCRDYNKQGNNKQGNQQVYYDELLTFIGNSMCNDTVNECPNEEFNTKKICPDITFMLTDRF